MPKIITFASPKGGCGATFTCAGVWQELAKMNTGVMAVDLCGAGCALDFALGFQNDSVYNASDVADGVCALNDALCISDYGDHACFLKGASDENIKTSELISILKKSAFEYILIDAPSEGNTEIFEKADKCVVLTDCTEVSARMCEGFASELDWDKCFLAINKIIPSYIKNGIMPNADELTELAGLRPVGLIPWIPEAAALYSMDISDIFKNKNLAKAFSNITARLSGGSAAAIDFNINYDCFKIKRR